MSELGHWERPSLKETATMLAGLEAPWWIAGGLAIDAFLGYESRAHDDIDVALPRRDQHELRSALAGWEFWIPTGHGAMRLWREGEELLLPQEHNVWCRPGPGAPWALEVLFEDAEGNDWLYRRNHAVRRPIETVRMWHEGVPFLAVEIALLFKAGAADLEKNAADFDACEPALVAGQRRWLIDSLQAVYPGHPWIERLDRNLKALQGLT